MTKIKKHEDKYFHIRKFSIKKIIGYPFLMVAFIFCSIGYMKVLDLLVESELYIQESPFNKVAITIFMIFGFIIFIVIAALFITNLTDD